MFVGCCPNEDVLPSLNDADKEFAMNSSTDNANMLALSNIAIEKSNSPVITGLANDLKATHVSATESLRILAMDLSLTLNNTINNSCANLEARLNSLPAVEFDSVYIHELRELQPSRTSMFSSELQAGLNERIKGYAQQQYLYASTQAATIDSIAEMYH